MRHNYYILKNHLAVVVPMEEWATWFEKVDRKVRETHLGAKVRVSTVFLGIDHQFGNGPPLIFETMIFGGRLNDSQWRYTTWDEAIVGHEAAVERVKESSLILMTFLRLLKRLWFFVSRGKIK